MEILLHTKNMVQKELVRPQMAGANFSSFIGPYKPGRVEKIRQEIDFREILNQIIRNQEVINANHGVEINVNVRKEAPFISDKRHTQLVLNNLISNTIRSQMPETPMPYVYIRIHSHDAGANILLRGNSAAVRKEARQVFNMLYKGPQKSEEFGFELYFIKQTIEKLNGRMEVEFQLDEGTEYNIYLPNLCQQ